MATPRKIIFKDYFDFKKCGGCNYQVQRFYCFEGQDIEEWGMCGYCFMDFLTDEKMLISYPTKEGGASVKT